MSQDSSVLVTRINRVEKHPNADRLSIATVFDNYPVVIRTGDFAEGDLAVYVPLDMRCPISEPEFSFLKGGSGGMHKLKAARLRGVFSMGLLVKPRPGMREGDDVTQALGCLKYVPAAEQEPVTRKERKHRAHELRRIRWFWGLWGALGVAAGAVVHPALAATSAALTGLGYWLYTRKPRVPSIQHYDIENFRRHADAFQEGEVVVCTEKIHGCHAAFYRKGKKIYPFSRTVHRPDDNANVWSKILRKYPQIATIPDGCILRGEIYGTGVQDLTYGAPEPEFRAFDIQQYHDHSYMNAEEFFQLCGWLEIPTVPLLYRGPFPPPPGMEEGRNTINFYVGGPGDHVREGYVMRPLTERVARGLGRVIVKVVGEGYLLRKGNDNE